MPRPIENALLNPADVEAAFERRARTHAAATDGKRRSLRGNALVTLIAALLMLQPLVAVAYPWLGQASLAQHVSIVGIGWLVFELACAAYAFFGPASGAYRVLDALDEAAAQGVLLALIYCSGVVASPLWFFLLILLLAWMPKTPARKRRLLVQLCVGHAALTTALLLSDQVASAMTTLIMLLNEVLTLSITGHFLAQGMRVRAERDLLEQRLTLETSNRDRDRVARDLHDGVGADLAALLMRLRTYASRSGTAAARGVAERAQNTMEALRGAVRILRDQQVSLGALGQVIGNRCEVAETARDRKLDASAAIAALAVARTLIEAAATRGGACRVVLAADAGVIDLYFDHAGAPLIEPNAELASARKLLDERGGRLAPVAGDGRLHATIPIRETGHRSG